MKYGDLSLGQVEAIVNKLGGMEGVKRFLSGKAAVDKAFKKARNTVVGGVRLFVDYTRPLANMIKEDGRFDYVNSDITEKNFQINRRPNGEAEMKVYHFNRDIDSDEAIREMDKEGYRPAELPEGLAYAKANPDEQRKYPIAILGSVWRDWGSGRVVPYLVGDGGRRSLDLYWYDIEWFSDFRFLAVRKS